MKKLQISFLIIFAFLSYDISAQIIDLEQVAKRTQRKIERRAQRKVDRTIDDGLDEVEDTAEGKNKKKRWEDEKYESSKESSSKESDVEELPTNRFNGKIILSMEKTSPSGESTTHRFKYISKSYGSIIIPIEAYDDIDFIQLSNKSKAIIIARTEEGEKKGRKDYFKYFDKTEAQAYTTVKTDETELMNDYICRKYILESEGATVTNWASMEIGLDYAKFLMELNYLSMIEDQLSDLNPSPYPVLDANIAKVNGETLRIKFEEVVEGDFDYSNYDISDYSLLDYTEY